MSLLDFIGAKDYEAIGDNGSSKMSKAAVKSSTSKRCSFLQAQMLLLSPDQQCQSTEGKSD